MEKVGHPLASMAVQVAVDRTIFSFACGNDQVAHTITRAVVVLEEEAPRGLVAASQASVEASAAASAASGTASKLTLPQRLKSEEVQVEQEPSG